MTVSKTAAQTNVDRWFPGKRYVPVIVSTKKCPLTYHQRLVYSYLVYRLRKDQAATKAKIVKVLRLAGKTVADGLIELERLSLTVKEQKWYRAVEPDESQKEWFASNRRTDVPWNRQFATYAVLQPKKASGLSTKTNAILWLLYSLAPKYGRPVVLGQYLAGLAAMLKMSGKGVKQGVEHLEELKLVERISTTFLLKQPTPESLALWEDRPVRQEKAFSLAGVLNLSIKNLDPNDPEAARKKDDLATINEFLDRHGLMMQKAGCPPGDIIEYWGYVIKNSNLDELWDYAVNFEGAFKHYGEQHRANGYSGSPMKLLWIKIKEHFPEPDPSTY